MTCDLDFDLTPSDTPCTAQLVQFLENIGSDKLKSTKMKPSYVKTLENACNSFLHLTKTSSF